MTDRDALLAAVIADPADDTVRLAYADWLQEHGEESWAEYIRVSVALEAARHNHRPKHFGGDPEGCPKCKLRNREFELWEEGTNPGGFLDVAPAAWGRVEWRRGFIELLTHITADDWFAHADAIRAAHPIRRVILTTRPAADGTYANNQLTIHLEGRDHWMTVGDREWDDKDAVKCLLEDEFEGVEFEVPPPTFDGVPVGPGDGVLLVNQTDPTDNGYRQYLDRLTREIQDHIVAPLVAEHFPGQLPPTVTFAPPPFRENYTWFRLAQDMGVNFSRNWVLTAAGLSEPADPPPPPPDPSA